MTLLGLQSAVAALIRCPKENRETDLKKFLSRFSLTEKEYAAAEELSEHKELNKYGHEQAIQRWDLMRKSVVRVPKHVNEELLEDIWFYSFEPQAQTVRSDHKGYDGYSLAFLTFLETDPETREVLEKEAPAYVWDLIKFEKVELELSRPLTLDPPLHKASAIKNPHFRVLDLEYDIPKLIAGTTKPKQLKRSLSLAVIRPKAKGSPRIFEIHEEMKAFLLSQISSKPLKVPNKDYMGDLGTMGLL